MKDLDVVLAVTLVGVFFLATSSVVSQVQIAKSKIGSDFMNLTAGWNLVSVTKPMVGKSLGSLASLKCGGATGEWISHGWLFSQGNWLLVLGTNAGVSKQVVDVETFTPDLAGFGLWINVGKVDAGGICSLTCGLDTCQPGTPGALFNK